MCQSRVACNNTPSACVCIFFWFARQTYAATKPMYQSIVNHLHSLRPRSDHLISSCSGTSCLRSRSSSDFLFYIAFRKRHVEQSPVRGSHPLACTHILTENKSRNPTRKTHLLTTAAAETNKSLNPTHNPPFTTEAASV